MLYMFLLHWNEENPSMTPEEAIAAHFAFAKDAWAKGAYVASEAIGGTAVATTVRVRNGNIMITDGPYAEAKEVVGGFYLLDCKDLDEALDYAARIPDAKSAGVEARPVMNVPGWDYGPTADYARQGRGEHTRIVTPSGTAERVFHEESGRILAALNRACGDFDLAEEAMQEAFAVAVERWPRDGVPSNPGAWITTTARRKTIDRLRRDQTIAQKRHLLETDVALDALAQDEDVTRVSELLDDRLRLTSPAAIRRSRGTRRPPSRCERSADSRRRKSRELFSCPRRPWPSAWCG